MNHLLNITKKELRELLTPGAIASIALVIVIFVVLGQGMSGRNADLSNPTNMGIALEEDPNTVIFSFDADGGTVEVTYSKVVDIAFKQMYGKDVDPTKYVHYLDPADYGKSDVITQTVSDKGYSYAIGIPKEVSYHLKNLDTYTEASVYYVYKDGGVFSSVSSVSAQSMVSLMSEVLTTFILESQGKTDPEAIQYPILTTPDTTYTLINGKVYTNVTPAVIQSSQMGQSLMIPIIVMLVISMVGSIVITSMGTEKENKTLETLLTMPVRRTTVVTGKLLSAVIMGLFYGVCYLVGMMFYSHGMTSGMSSVNLNDYGLGMTPVGWIILFVVLFLQLFSALGICMILGAFTRNLKMAQTMIMPITVLAMLPMMVFLFQGWYSLPPVLQGIIFAIPFQHPMMAMSNIVTGNMLLIAGGIIYLVVIDAILVAITVKVYNSDILITGYDFKNLRLFKKMESLSKKTR